MAAYEGSPVDTGLNALIEASPDSEAHTSAAAEASFLLSLAALVSAPFSTMFAVSVLMALLSIVCGLVGIVRTSRPEITGGAMASFALVAAGFTLALIGLRYAGLDTAFGDVLGPSILERLNDLNSRLPSP